MATRCIVCQSLFAQVGQKEVQRALQIQLELPQAVWTPHACHFENSPLCFAWDWTCSSAKRLDSLRAKLRPLQETDEVGETSQFPRKFALISQDRGTNRETCNRNPFSSSTLGQVYGTYMGSPLKGISGRAVANSIFVVLHFDSENGKGSMALY